MTNDQQQVEAWRIEYEAAFPKPTYIYFDNGYLPKIKIDAQLKAMASEYQYGFEVFQHCKRNQPVIELPMPATDHYHQGELNIVDVARAITAAGYTYTVAK